MLMHELSQQDARRIAVRAQLLTADRPDELMTMVEQLTLLQVDLTEAVAPSADLVVWSRLGDDGDPRELADLVDQQRLIDLFNFWRPWRDVALYTAEMALWPGPGELKPWQEDQVAWVDANRGCRLDILDRLRADGPLPARALPDTCDVPWRSSGWTNNKNVQKLLELMLARGEVAVPGREGRERVWDLAERVYPDVEPVPLGPALRERQARRLRSLGIARARAPVTPNEPNDVDLAGEPATVAGVKGVWRVDPAQLGQPFAGRTALLSPLDRLIFDRKRMAELFDFDYQLEMYKPADTRRWGYYALPVLHGDRLVGKVDATSDREHAVLRVDAIHQDQPFDRGLRAAVNDELASLARWLGLALELPD
jgi:uncharacterized protein YcaQ